MKINVEIDCTPDEARRVMGLPDFTPVHDAFIASLTDAMAKGPNPEMIDAVLKGWMPMGEAGLSMWRRMFDPPGSGG